MVIKLEVQGYAKGRMLLEKKVVRVKVGDKPWREARDGDFDKALSWLMSQGYRYVGKSAAPRIGTVKVVYKYE